MTQGITQFPAGTLAKGINVNIPDFTADVTLDASTVNVTSGIHEGIGPRYGISPIPGQNDQEVPATGKLPGLMRAELGFSSGCDRTNVYAIYTVILGGGELPSGTGSILNTRATYYPVLIGYTDVGYSGTILDVNFLGTSVSGFGYFHSKNIYDGLEPPAVVEATQVLSLLTEYVQWPTNSMTHAQQLATLLTTNGAKSISSSAFAVTGQENPMEWMMGPATPSGSSPPVVSFVFYANFNGNGLGKTYSGWASPYGYQKFNTTDINTLIYSLDDDGNYVAGYQAFYAPNSAVYLPTFQESDAFSASFTVAGQAIIPLSGGSGVYVDTIAAVINDASMTVNSSYKGLLICGTNPIIAVFQDWYRTVDGLLTQYIDPVNVPLANVPSSTYTESGAPVSTCFTNWPAFVRGTAMGGTTDGALLLGANTGLLRANQVYEVTYSLYDKRLNYETNVGKPVKVQVGSTDLVALQIFAATSVGSYTAASYITTGNMVLPFPGDGVNGFGPTFHINYLQYRFYYRVEGDTTWIPTTQIDMAQFWFAPVNNHFLLATQGVGSLPGGEQGGFQDYSTLPQDQYTCAVFYKNRAFWLSDKAMIFSLNNNPLAYPARNSIACPAGDFKGAIVQAYYGQATQNARLVVFSTDGTYVGQFTGNLEQVPVQLGDGTQANFGLDGSDFVLNAWTDVTAFSYRCAVVAQGILYFWGPQGIHMDDGVDPITRISVPLEPDIFTSYDPAATDSFFANYNDTTKEVWFFYTSTGGTTSQAYVYNIVRQTWLKATFNALITDVQAVNISTGIATAGNRTVIFAEVPNVPQRAYFFDQVNRAGDFYPGADVMVKAISSPTAATRRLTIAAGGTTELSSYAVGDTLTLQQFSAYSGQTGTDMMAIIAAINTGAGTVDITLPPGGSLPSSWTASGNQFFFPIWQAHGNGATMTAGLNGINYLFSSKYWVPAGMKYWAYWQYLHMLFKAETLLPNTNDLTVLFGYKTPVSPSYQQDRLTILDNSDSNCQILHQLQPGNMDAEGQGLRMQFSGVQIGSEWVLQYLEAYTRFLDGLHLNVFEG